jgi:hypothetical protein
MIRNRPDGVVGSQITPMGFSEIADKHLFLGRDFRKSHPYRISYLRAAGRKGFWATRRRGPEVGSSALSTLDTAPFV